MICIYQLTFTEGIYIGKTTNLKSRMAHHLQKDNCGWKLKQAWETQGYLGHKVLEECSTQDLNAREIYWIETLTPNLNVLPGGETMAGLNHPCNKTSLEDIEEVVRLLELNFKYSCIAEATGLPYSRVYDICTGKAHVWATEHLNLEDYKVFAPRIFYGPDNTRYEVGYGEIRDFCVSKGMKPTSLNNLSDKPNMYGYATVPHPVYEVQTPIDIQTLTLPQLKKAMQDNEESKYTISQVLKNRESRGWKILS